MGFIEYDIDMQTFLISPDYSETSKILDYRRLGKQRVECWQILNILLTLKIHPNTKLAWMNHPAVLMWKGYEYQLCKYGIEISKNWINRGYKDSMLPKFQSWLRRMNYFSQPIGRLCYLKIKITTKNLSGKKKLNWNIFGRSTNK